MQFTLFTSDCRGQAQNCCYPHRMEITSPEELAEACRNDQVFAAYKGSRRSVGSFLRSDVIPMDVDNDHTEDPEQWLTREKLSELFAAYDHVIFPSRNHMREKNGRAARPKFHVLFPVRGFDSAEKYAAAKAAIQKEYPFFDGNALDAARFFFGTDFTADQVSWNESFLGLQIDELPGVVADTASIGSASMVQSRSTGRNSETQYGGGADTAPLASASMVQSQSTSGNLETRYATDVENKPSSLIDNKAQIEPYIKEGTRNHTMSLFAGKVLKRYGICEKAYALFLERSKQCDPPLPENELETVWLSAVKFAEKIMAQPDYIPPEQYSAAHRSPQSLKPADYTDSDEADVLVREFRNELRYTKATDLLRYDGSCWREGKAYAYGALLDFTVIQRQEARDLVKAAEEALVAAGIDAAVVRARGRLLEKACVDKNCLGLHNELNTADKYLGFVLKYRNLQYLSSVQTTAKTLVEVDISDLDKDPYLLNTPEGTYDLREGMGGLKPHDPEDLITKITAVSPGDQGRELWEAALNTFFCGDAELIEYVRLNCGLAAIGRVFREQMVIAYGDGANGKSTFWNTISRVLGSYSGSISAESLTTACRHNVRPEIAELKGKRLVIAAELEEGRRLSTSIIKQLCSTDEITAEKKYRDPFRFTPSHTLVLYTNHRPKVGARDAGTWRRLLVIPFQAKIEGTSDISNYADYLFENAGPYILRWVIEGARQVIRLGYRIPQPKAVQEATDNYRETNDWLKVFLDEYCEVSPKYTEKSGELYRQYRTVCAENGEYIRSTTDFYGALKNAGFERRKTATSRLVLGLRLKPGQDFPD